MTAYNLKLNVCVVKEKKYESLLTQDITSQRLLSREEVKSSSYELCKLCITYVYISVYISICICI